MGQLSWVRLRIGLDLIDPSHPGRTHAFENHSSLADGSWFRAGTLIGDSDFILIMDEILGIYNIRNRYIISFMGIRPVTFISRYVNYEA